MAFDMVLRDLHLRAGTNLDLAAARTLAGDLCRDATADSLRVLLNEEWIRDQNGREVDLGKTHRLRHTEAAHTEIHRLKRELSRAQPRLRQPHTVDD
jgi:hypothetical protein